MTARGMTLLETLAAITLISLMTGIGVSVFSRSLSSSDRVGRLCVFDARVRLLARQHGPYALHVETTTDEIVLRAACLRKDGHDVELMLPPDSVIAIDGGHDRIVFDAAGRSGDYSVKFSDPMVEISVAGLTGWTQTTYRADRR